MPEMLCFRMGFGPLFGDLSRFFAFYHFFTLFPLWAQKGIPKTLPSLKVFWGVDCVTDKVRKSALFSTF